MFRQYRAYITVIRLVLSYKWATWKSRFMSREKAQSYFEKINRKNAVILRDAFINLKGLYLKLGQLISILATALPQTFRDELTVLQDRLPPRTFEDIRPRLETEWGKKVEDVLATIEPTALAAASIGQVHRATLRDGGEVVVKVQYPGLEKILETDLKAFKGIVRILSWFYPDAELGRIYEEIKLILMEEIDFKIEAANMQRFQDDFKDNISIRAPHLYSELSTKTVLVSEFIDGFKINDTARMKEADIDPESLSELLIEAYAFQLFEYGFYHADPHPGNVMVLPGPELIFIDFGAACVISERTREAIVEFIQAGVRKDSQGLIKAMQKMGFIAIEADPRIYDKVVSHFHDKFHQEIGLENLRLGNIKLNFHNSADNLSDLKRMNITIKDLSRTFHVPREWVLLERAMLSVMGIVTDISPNLDVMDSIMPHLKRFSVKYGLDPSSLMVSSMRQLAINTFALPAEIRNLISRINYGELELSFAETDRILTLFYYVVQEFFFGYMGYSMITSAFRYEDMGHDDRAFYFKIGASICSFFFLRGFSKAWITLRQGRK
ncbi:MAG: AarF/ABC1/UbiB kinase family protein [Deltaproteobacteria bacterium]|nr:AarF/ABC1/UbiB kinase family protein [Deltaproteobacteria bacterium]